MKRYITTAIPYVNAKPHIGHALEYIEADMIVRYHRSLGDDLRWQWGTDDNSLKNVRAAQVAGEETEAFVARHAEVFRGLGPLLNLTFDDFMRTRDERHIRGAQKLWSMFKPEDIYKKSYTGLYCVGCETFYTTDEAPEGHCTIHKKKLEEVSEENYFFKLSNYQQQLEDLVSSDTLKIFPETRKNEALGFIRQGLQDFSISRSVERAEHWGIPVPNDASQVMYVWVDALSQYVTALGFADNAAPYKTYWSSEVKKVHILGKDIMRFHAVYWPAFLLSAGLSLPNELFVHGFFTVNGEKMSKSLGNVLDPEDLVANFGVDAVRYAFLRSLPAANDGDMSLEKMEERYADLANGLGNLVSRVAAMANKYFDGNISPVMITEEEPKLAEAIATYDCKSYIDSVWTWVDCANAKIDTDAPFKLVKTNEAAAKTSLEVVAGYIVAVATALAPVIPDASAKILAAYRADHVDNVTPLFPRRDAEILSD